MAHASTRHPGWLEGWAVVKGSPTRWEFVGIYDTEEEARASREAQRDGYTVRWGFYYPQTKDFVTGDPD
jgi:hypothetical protein